MFKIMSIEFDWVKGQRMKRCYNIQKRIYYIIYRSGFRCPVLFLANLYMPYQAKGAMGMTLAIPGK